jgi:hypothetical protein
MRIVLAVMMIVASAVIAEYQIGGVPQPNSMTMLSFKIAFSPAYACEVWQQSSYVIHDVVTTNPVMCFIKNAVTNIYVQGEVTNIFYTDAMVELQVVSTNDVTAYSFEPQPVTIGTVDTVALSEMTGEQIGWHQTNTVKELFDQLIKIGMTLKHVDVQGGGL